MTAAGFPKTQYFIVISGSAAPTMIGTLTFTDALNFSLSDVQLWLQKVGAHVGGEMFRVSVYSDAAGTNRLFSSDWVTMTDISSISSSSWYGYLTFPFSVPGNINNARSYYIGVEALGYTRAVDDSYYWVAAIDWPLAVNAYGSETYRGAAMSIVGLYS